MVHHHYEANNTQIWQARRATNVRKFQAQSEACMAAHIYPFCMIVKILCLLLITLPKQKAAIVGLCCVVPSIL